MKILVFSDSHGTTRDMIFVIEREKPDLIVHLGDHTTDARELERVYRNIPVYAVRGNNDWCDDAPDFIVARPDAIPLYLTHGHREHVGMLSSGMVSVRAKEEGCAMAFFGHTHRMMLENVNGIWVMNPGSISLPRGGPASYGRLTLDRSGIHRAELLDEDGGLLRCQRME